MDIVPSAWAMPSLRKSHTVSAKSSPKTTIRNSKTNEFRWLLNGTEHTLEWQNRHFVPVFIRRKAEEQEKSYYFVGSAVALDDVRESVNRSEDGRESKVVVSTLKLIKPVDPELYRHLTGKSAL